MSWRRLGWMGAPLFAVAGIVILWQIACQVFAVPPFILPAPIAIIRATWGVGLGPWADNLWATLKVVLAGFAVSIVISLPIAVMLVNSPLLRRTVMPLLVVVQSTPIVAIAPIIVVTLGSGFLPRVVITTLITFFPLVVSTATGLAATPAELIELSRSLRGGRARELFQIRLPYAVPHIFSGLRICVTLAVVGAVIAEFVAAQKGLGYEILYTTSMFKTAQAFGALVILVALSMLLYQSVIWVERRFFPWSLPRESR